MSLAALNDDRHTINGSLPGGNRFGANPGCTWLAEPATAQGADSGRSSGAVVVTIAFRIFCCIDLLVAAIFLYFFAWGLSDGTVSSHNIYLWLGILGGVGGILASGLALNAAGRRGSASVLLALLAVPGIGCALFFLLLVLTVSNWH